MKDWTCSTCETENPFTPWVHAHWDIKITATCAGCGDEWKMQHGKIQGPWKLSQQKTGHASDHKET